MSIVKSLGFDNLLGDVQRMDKRQVNFNLKPIYGNIYYFYQILF